MLADIHTDAHVQVDRHAYHNILLPSREQSDQTVDTICTHQILIHHIY